MSERAAILAAVAAGAGVLAWVLWRRIGVGYSEGAATGPVWLSEVDGVLVPASAAGPLRSMQAAAASAGVRLQLNSGFRTNAEQAELYGQYQRGERTAVAAEPGHSNHQRGEPEPSRGRGPAVDIAVQSSEQSREYLWLAANAARFGFRRTVASEPWHWEFVGGA